jgi:hypothetical protein
MKSINQYKNLSHNLVRENSPPNENSFFNILNKLFMKHIFLTFFLFLTTTLVFGQLTKGHWLIGGSGRFNTYKNEIFNSVSTSNGKYTKIDISPNIGYFLADKFAVGLKTTITSIKGDFSVVGGVGTGGSNTQRYSLGLFSRYYFLEKEKQTNILVDVNYQTGIIRGLGKGAINSFSISTGPVVYFNSSVGIEFLVGYIAEKEKYTSEIFSEQNNGFQFSIGLQIHLIK